MLSDKYKRYFYSLSDNESWEEYFKRLSLTENKEIRYFIQHILFDHFSNFTGRFPLFAIESHNYTFEYWKASRIHKTIKYDFGEELDFWYEHVQTNPDPKLTLLKFMLDEKTWPTPIVIFDFSDSYEEVQELGDRVTSVHLIEGTNRVSYFKKMLLRALIEKDSKHKILVVRKS